MLHGIKNIIFDLGGVIYDLNHSLSQEAFFALGMPGLQELFTHSFQADIFNQLETGSISTIEFRNQIRAIGKKEISDEQIDFAFNALLIGFNHPEYFDLLLRLKNKYRTFLLSNNNEIHYDFIKKELDQMGENKSLSDYFEKDYYSHKMGLRKPSLEIFEELMILEKLVPSETLFIDDTLVHIQTAQKLGIHTYHKKQEEDLAEIIDQTLGFRKDN